MPLVAKDNQCCVGIVAAQIRSKDFDPSIRSAELANWPFRNEKELANLQEQIVKVILFFFILKKFFS